MVRLVLLLVALAGPVAAEEVLPPDLATLEIVFDERAEPPFEGEMVLATVRGVYRVRIRLEELVLRRLADLDWVRLGDDTWSEEMVEGQPARVLRRRVAFFPKRAGTLRIPPVAHKLTYAAPGGRPREGLVRSEPVTLEARPAPVAADEGWMPVRALELSDTWSTDPAALDDHEIAHRRVVIRALGATPEMMPRMPPMEARWLVSLALPERRSMQVTPEGPVTTVTWDWSLKPRTGETGILEEARFPYFDTTDRAARTAIVPARAIGYADFADNSLASWRSEVSGRWSVAAPLLAGFAVALALAAQGRRTRALRAAAHRRLILLRLRRRLRRAVREGNATAFRRAALDLAASAGQGEAVVRRLIEPLDRRLFGPERPGAGPDLPDLAAAVLCATASARPRGDLRVVRRRGPEAPAP
ncbi:MAG: hypothetical protein ACFBWO_17970 [Paracoccaceae bacterium]